MSLSIDVLLKTYVPYKANRYRYSLFINIMLLLNDLSFCLYIIIVVFPIDLSFSFSLYIDIGCIDGFCYGCFSLSIYNRYNNIESN